MVTMDNIQEIWRPIPTWEGYYEVSNLGRFRQLSRAVQCSNGRVYNITEKIKKLTPNHKNKYLMITLSENATNRHETHCGHRIVAQVFIPNPLNLPEVNHLKSKNDISVIDLEWTTSSDNKKDAFKRGLSVSKKGSQNSISRKIGRYKNDILLQVYDCMKYAEKDGYESSAIRQAIKNGWKCGGFEWKYLSPPTIIRKERANKKIAAVKNNCVFKTYKNINEVVKDGYDKSNIYKALKNQFTTSGGFYWKYIDEKAA